MDINNSLIKVINTDDINKSFYRNIYMYTLYQFIAVVIVLMYPKILPVWAKDIVKASCIIIALLVFIITYFIIGYTKLIQLIRALFPFIPYDIGTYIFPLGNLLVHYVVVLLLGLPKNIVSVIYASCVIYIWIYIININNNSINSIYGTEIDDKDINKILFVYIPLINIFIIFLCLLTKYI